MLVKDLIGEAGEKYNLTDVRELVLRESLLGTSYQDMAQRSNYEHGYLKKVGSQLWRLLSQRLGKKISKTNVRSHLQQHIQQDVRYIMSHSLNSSQPENSRSIFCSFKL